MEDKKPSATPPQERVTITKEIAGKLDLWLEQLGPHLKWAKINRSDLANWVLERASEKLSTLEIDDLVSRHHDRVKATEWALREMRIAREKGQDLSLEDLLPPAILFSNQKRREKKPTRKKAAKTANETSEANLKFPFEGLSLEHDGDSK